MFNILVTADDTAWETDQRMRMTRQRFLEYSGDEASAASLGVEQPDRLRALEQVPSLLMYEQGLSGQHTNIVRLGQIRDTRVESSTVSFRFRETGRAALDKVVSLRHRLQMDSFEFHRTHWAVKDGDIPQDVLAEFKESPRQYDIALSFAGEDRTYVEQVAASLESNGIAVFYDKYEQTTLWGKDLHEHFDAIYRKFSRFCVMFISRHYADKMWTSHERRSAFSRAMERPAEYVLPVRFDDTEVPGLRPTIGYIDISSMTPEGLGRLILEKLGRQPQSM